jgi:hypothetical protein
MKTSMLRLGSLGPYGAGGPSAGAMNFIYSQLLQEFEINSYRYIFINQIGDEHNEVIVKFPNKININVRYHGKEDFELLSDFEQNKFRLEVIHIGLCRIAEYEHKIDINKLNLIKEKILANNFDFTFDLKTFENKKKPGQVGILQIKPENKRFNFFISDGKSCTLPIFSGAPNDFYFGHFFSNGKWTAKNELIITGSAKEVEIKFNVEECKVEFKNLTAYDKPPTFEMMRSDRSEEDKARAYRDWINSIPPAFAAIIDRSVN